MPVKVTFELSDPDLEHFREVMLVAREKARGTSEEVVLASARRLAAETRKRRLPGFVASRLASLETLVQMLEDVDWSLAGAHRDRVLGALAYFAEPDDMIPDNVPGIGYLDDAILVELVVQELRPELDAYDEFRRLRDEQGLAGGDSAAHRDELAMRRREMYRRMERRRGQRDRRGGLFSMFR